jgi:hypothetical protein
MTSKRRRLWILVLWTMALVAFAWFFIPRLAWGDDEYFKWFIFGMLAFGPRWFLDFLVVLLVGFSLERRRGLRRLYILCVWALITAGAVWLNVLRPTIPPSSPYEHSLRLRASVHLFAFPWLFALLVALWIALWLEERFATRFRKE